MKIIRQPQGFCFNKMHCVQCEDLLILLDLYDWKLNILAYIISGTKNQTFEDVSLASGMGILHSYLISYWLFFYLCEEGYVFPFIHLLVVW